jgi:uncharacterized delta-60 repeat protein
VAKLNQQGSEVWPIGMKKYNVWGALSSALWRAAPSLFRGSCADPSAIASVCATSRRQGASLLFFTVLTLRLVAEAQSPSADSFNPPAPDYTFSLAVQSDGMVLVGGANMLLVDQGRTNFYRLHPGGTLDTSFSPGADGAVSCMAVQADGRILVAGGFNTLGGQSCHLLGRLHQDGTLDASFSTGASGSACLALQADGKILVGSPMARLNPDGTVDTNFNAAALNGALDGSVACVAVQPNGKILLGGSFTKGLRRANADGTLDSTFNPVVNDMVRCVALQADGRILVGGWFTTLNGAPRNYIGRLYENGALDPSFNPGVLAGFYQGSIDSIVVQADGKIVVGGVFTSLRGQSRDSLGRLNADGTLDTSFNPGATASPDVSIPTVRSMALQGDGKILVGGHFQTLGGQNRYHIGRLNNTEPATHSLVFDGSNLTWMRGGTSPEVWRTRFEFSSDGGASWTDLGPGNRIPGGWQLSGLALATNANFRGQGFTTSGYWNTSCEFVEDVIGPPLIGTQPASQTNNAGTTAALTAYAGGDELLSYRWWKGNAPLTDQGDISGTTTPNLVLSDVLGSDGGGYRVVVSNTSGSVTSAVAILTVIDPLLTVQPVSQDRNAGESMALTVGAIGTEPLSYQWHKDGLARPGATQSALTLTNLQGADAGSYDVLVSNMWGTVTSTAAVLRVNLALTDSFNPGARSDVSALALQADGGILVGGSRLLSRINANGTPDSNFDFRVDNSVGTMAVQPDGKILVGGYFNLLAGESRNSIGRLNADGTLDMTFNPGANGWVSTLAVQDDGRILVAGNFTLLAGQNRTNLARLNPDGTLDTAFAPGVIDNTVYSLALRPDGKILVGGWFTTLGGQNRNGVARLNADGTVDSSFNPTTGIDYAYWVVLQADGKVLVGGYTAGQASVKIARLNVDGTLDASFAPGLIGFGDSVALQADGKILLGGSFGTPEGQNTIYLARLNGDGTLDTSFNPKADGAVNALAVQADGKILLAGSFGTLGGQIRNRLARLNNTYPATQSLTFDGTTLTWMRGGTSPEVWRTTFEYSVDGISWTNLGAGVRIPGGWQLTGLALPRSTTFRARGFAVGGNYNSSSWFVETISGPGFAISDPLLSASGQFQFSASGRPGGVFVVEASPDLLTWVPLQTNTLGAGPLPFTDFQATNFTRRFYRLRAQ